MALVKVFHMTLRDRLFGCRHEWAFALGNKPGVLTNVNRELCFRRVCMKCERREEIAQYRAIYTADNGDTFMALPVWVEEDLSSQKADAKP